MKPGSVLVDIAIDQGGCFEDSRPTTHADPTYQVHDSVFYCVANMPGAVPHTSTYALTNVTLPYAVALADQGWRDALREDAALALGLNTHARRCSPTTRWRRRTSCPPRTSPTSSPDARGKASGIACRTAIVRSHVAGWWLLLVRVRQCWRARQPVG